MVTEQTTNSAVDTEVPAPAATERRAATDLSAPGQLAAAREAAGLSASEVAGRLGMATRQIEALERGDWESLPGQAFVRAALRSYGKTVGVDVAPLLATLGGQVEAPVLKASSTLESPIPRGGGFGFGGGSSGVGGRLAWIVLGIAAVIAIVFYFGPGFQFGDDAGEPEQLALRANGASGGGNAPANNGTPGAAGPSGNAATSPGGQGASSGNASPATGGASNPGGASTSGAMQPLAPLAPLAPAPAAGGDAAAASTTSSGAVATGAQGAAASTADATPPRTAGRPPSDAAGETSTLSLSFGRESWVEIREAGGRVLLTGTQAAGSERSLTGKRPLSLVIGNAQHVRLERDGEPVDLAGRSRQGVARFTLE